MHMKGDIMNIDIRKSIIDNFKTSDINDIKSICISFIIITYFLKRIF